MKIFINARFLTQPVSGVQRYGIECSRQIKKLYPEVTFISPSNILNTSLAEELNVRVTGMNTGHLWEQLDLPLFMLKQKQAPLLNFANTAPLFYKNNYITIHDLAFYHHPEWNSILFSTWYNLMIPRLAKKSKHIFTVSQTIKNEIGTIYKISSSKITLTYNGVSRIMLDFVAKAKQKKEKIIFSVGTFNLRKNHKNLVTAFIESGLGSEYQLIITGDKNRVFREADIDEKMMVNNNIKIYASLSEDELIKLYQKAEIVVSVSLYEGFGIPLLEGLYNGCKIICSDIPVYKELYEHYAEFCDPKNIQSIINSLNKTANATKELPEEALAVLVEKYNYRHSAQIILDKIRQLNTI